jgi:hypothetical protein
MKQHKDVFSYTAHEVRSKINHCREGGFINQNQFFAIISCANVMIRNVSSHRTVLVYFSRLLKHR